MRRTVLACDLHEDAMPAVAAAAVTVTVDGVAHRLDLCADHVELMRSLPQAEGATGGSFLDEPTAAGAAATKAAAAAPAHEARRREGSRRSLRAERAAARDWARQQGMAVGDKGRLPAGLLEEYRKLRAV